MTPKQAFQSLVDTMDYASYKKENMKLSEFIDICEEEFEVLKEYFGGDEED